MKGSIKRSLLFRLWQLGDFEGLADTDFVGQECLGDGRM
jgi:hypothetical protein